MFKPKRALLVLRLLRQLEANAQPPLIILVLDIHVPEGGQSIRISYFCAIVAAGATIYTYLAFFESNIVGAYLTVYTTISSLRPLRSNFIVDPKHVKENVL